MSTNEVESADGRPVERTPAATGTVHAIDSAILKETRRYWVYLPPSYDDADAADRRYPVVVHLDGQSHGAWSPTTVEYMIRRRRLPEVIVVGVYNIDQENGLGSAERARDLTPTHSLLHHDGTPNDCYRLSGGGDRFGRFLEEELLPCIDKEYRTRPHRALVGQSLSGCFVLDVFLGRCSRNQPGGTPASASAGATGTTLLAPSGRRGRRPSPEDAMHARRTACRDEAPVAGATFQAFVAMDPCLWWDGDRAKRLTAELELGSPIFERGLFVAFSGTDDANRAMQQAWFEELVGKATEPNRRHLRFAHYPEENHISMNLKGFYEGLAFLFGRPCGLDWAEQT